MSKFIVGETYKTRGGRDVKIIAVLSGSNMRPVVGSYNSAGVEVIGQWPADGRMFYRSPTADDLMPRTTSTPSFVNVYETPEGFVFFGRPLRDALSAAKAEPVGTETIGRLKLVFDDSMRGRFES